MDEIMCAIVIYQCPLLFILVTLTTKNREIISIVLRWLAEVVLLIWIWSLFRRTIIFDSENENRSTNFRFIFALMMHSYDRDQIRIIKDPFGVEEVATFFNCTGTLELDDH